MFKSSPPSLRSPRCMSVYECLSCCGRESKKGRGLYFLKTGESDAMQDMWLSVNVSIDYHTVSPVHYSLSSLILCLNAPPFSSLLFYIYYISVFLSQCGGPGCRGLLASRYIFVLREDCDINQVPLVVINKNDRVSSPPIIRLYIFAAISLVFTLFFSFFFCLSHSWFFSFTSYRFVICISRFVSIIFFFVLQNPFHVSRNHITIFSFHFIVPLISIHKHTKKKYSKLLKLLQFIFVVSFCPKFHDFVLDPSSLFCHPIMSSLFFNGSFWGPTNI